MDSALMHHLVPIKGKMLAKVENKCELMSQKYVTFIREPSLTSVFVLKLKRNNYNYTLRTPRRWPPPPTPNQHLHQVERKCIPSRVICRTLLLIRFVTSPISDGNSPSERSHWYVNCCLRVAELFIKKGNGLKMIWGYAFILLSRHLHDPPAEWHLCLENKGIFYSDITVLD